MLNISALSELLALLESADALESDRPQPANMSMIADAEANAVSHRQRSSRILMRIFMADSSFLPLLSVAQSPSYKQPMPGDRPVPRPDSCARHRGNPRDWQRRVCKHTH